MSFLWRLFRREKPPDDYETVLANLATNIEKRQTALLEIRTRQRTTTTLVTLYTLAAWLAYLGVWYFGFVSGGKGERVRGAERVVRALPVFVGPILILFIRRIVQIWYNRKGNAEEKTLQALMKEQRDKVEEIKKKTNFYSTRDLLSRYDGSASAPSTPQRGGAPPTPQRGGGPAPAPANGRAPRPSGILPPSASASVSAAPRSAASPPPATPARRGIFDALADLLVGAEDTDGAPASQRYALICEKCFAHNGLVPQAMWADAQYRCPQCGHFNASARSRRVLERAGQVQPVPSPVGAVSSPVSPTSAATSPGSSALAPAEGEGVRRRSSRRGDGEEDGETKGVDMEVDS